MYRRELFDKSLGKEREFIKKKKSIDSRKNKHEISQKKNVPFT